MNDENNDTNSDWNNCTEVYRHQEENEGKPEGVEQQIE